MTRHRRLLSRVLLAAGLAVLADRAHAGGSLAYDTTGGALVWKTNNPIGYKTDLGGLGSFDNTQANQMVADAFALWQGVPTAAITYQRWVPSAKMFTAPRPRRRLQELRTVPGIVRWRDLSAR